MSATETAHPDQTFYGQHPDQLQRLFEIVELPEANQGLAEAVAATQPWVKGDHARPKHRLDFDEPESTELYAIYDSLGLRQAHELPPGHYDHTIVLGGVHRGNNRRLAFMRDALTTGVTITDDITLLGGERRIYPEIEHETICENLRKLAGLDDPWLKKLRIAESTTLWETDLLRLAALRQIGPLAVEGADEADPSGINRPHLQTFTWRNIPLAIMHTKAVARQGENRHNTEACIRDWLTTTEPADQARVAFMSANPHLIRMGRSTRAVLRTEGRTDIDLVVAGPASPDYAGHNHYLGEIARHLYEDQRSLEA